MELNVFRNMKEFEESKKKLGLNLQWSLMSLEMKGLTRTNIRE